MIWTYPNDLHGLGLDASHASLRVHRGGEIAGSLGSKRLTNVRNLSSPFWRSMLTVPFPSKLMAIVDQGAARAAKNYFATTKRRLSRFGHDRRTVRREGDEVADFKKPFKTLPLKKRLKGLDEFDKPLWSPPVKPEKINWAYVGVGLFIGVCSG